jgi:hypothetical protein
MATQNQMAGLLVMLSCVPKEAIVTDFNVLSRYKNNMKTSTPQFEHDACGNHTNRMSVSCVEENAFQTKVFTILNI